MSERHLDMDVVHRYLLEGALTPDERREADGHLQACAQCRAQVQSVKEDAAEFEALHLERTLANVQRRLAPDAASSKPLRSDRPERPWRTWGLSFGALAAASLLWAVFRPGTEGPDIHRGAFVARGSQNLSVYVKRGDEVFKAGPGEELRPGDRLGFQVDPAGCPHLLLIAENASGARSSLVATFGGDAPRSLPVGDRPRALDAAFELGSVDDLRHLYGVFSKEPFTEAEALTSIDAYGKAEGEAGASCPLSILSFGGAAAR